jgi:hypothetical protein
VYLNFEISASEMPTFSTDREKVFVRDEKVNNALVIMPKAKN